MTKGPCKRKPRYLKIELRICSLETGKTSVHFHFTVRSPCFLVLYCEISFRMHNIYGHSTNRQFPAT